MIKVEKVFLHPHFHSYTFDSDVALIYLAEQVELGPSALPVCLPTPQLASYLHKVLLLVPPEHLAIRGTASTTTVCHWSS